jgi:hypothetical protein
MEAAVVAGQVAAFEDESIYDEDGRLAQPDEVWNYERGDGVERAVLLANILRPRTPDAACTLEIGKDTVKLSVGDETYEFPTRKNLKQQTWDLAAAAEGESAR